MKQPLSTEHTLLQLGFAIEELRTEENTWTIDAVQKKIREAIGTNDPQQVIVTIDAVAPTINSLAEDEKIPDTLPSRNVPPARDTIPSSQYDNDDGESGVWEVS